ICFLLASSVAVEVRSELDTMIARRRTMYLVTGFPTLPAANLPPIQPRGRCHGYSYRNGVAVCVHNGGYLRGSPGCARAAAASAADAAASAADTAALGPYTGSCRHGAVNSAFDVAFDSGLHGGIRRLGRAAERVRPRIAHRGVPDRSRRRAAGLRVARAGSEPRAAGPPRRLCERPADRRPVRRGEDAEAARRRVHAGALAVPENTPGDR